MKWLESEKYFGVLPGSLATPRMWYIYEGEVGATGKVLALSTSGALGLSVFLQHRLNESCEAVNRPDSGREEACLRSCHS